LNLEQAALARTQRGADARGNPLSARRHGAQRRLPQRLDLPGVVDPGQMHPLAAADGQAAVVDGAGDGGEAGVDFAAGRAGVDAIGRGAGGDGDGGGGFGEDAGDRLAIDAGQMQVAVDDSQHRGAREAFGQFPTSGAKTPTFARGRRAFVVQGAHVAGAVAGAAPAGSDVLHAVDGIVAAKGSVGFAALEKGDAVLE
jgi:hypothetical protein